MEDESIVTLWLEFRTLIDTLEVDVVKNAKGTAAAGVRARKGLRDLKARAAHLVKLTVQLDKTRRTSRAEARAAKKVAAG